ncbi:hypothetical protein EDB85DRAFT_1897778 [Lactarius pseudohatsudake]|nr:hypothetical protein EDB85DRAFT_1897778 [Lactarius pseudohatsudake]
MSKPRFCLKVSNHSHRTQLWYKMRTSLPLSCTLLGCTSRATKKVARDSMCTNSQARDWAMKSEALVASDASGRPHGGKRADGQGVLKLREGHGVLADGLVGVGRSISASSDGEVVQFDVLQIVDFVQGVLCWVRFDPVADALALNEGANFGSFLFCFFVLQFILLIVQGLLGVFLLLCQPVLLFLFDSVLLELLVPGSSLVIVLSGPGFSQALSGTFFGEGVYAWEIPFVALKVRALRSGWVFEYAGHLPGVGEKQIACFAERDSRENKGFRFSRLVGKRPAKLKSSNFVEVNESQLSGGALDIGVGVGAVHGEMGKGNVCMGVREMGKGNLCMGVGEMGKGNLCMGVGEMGMGNLCMSVGVGGMGNGNLCMGGGEMGKGNLCMGGGEMGKGNLCMGVGESVHGCGIGMGNLCMGVGEMGKGNLCMGVHVGEMGKGNVHMGVREMGKGNMHMGVGGWGRGMCACVGVGGRKGNLCMGVVEMGKGNLCMGRWGRGMCTWVREMGKGNVHMGMREMGKENLCMGVGVGVRRMDGEGEGEWMVIKYHLVVLGHKGNSRGGLKHNVAAQRHPMCGLNSTAAARHSSDLSSPPPPPHCIHFTDPDHCYYVTTDHKMKSPTTTSEP